MLFGGVELCEKMIGLGLWYFVELFLLLFFNVIWVEVGEVVLYFGELIL